MVRRSKLLIRLWNLFFFRNWIRYQLYYELIQANFHCYLQCNIGSFWNEWRKQQSAANQYSKAATEKREATEKVSETFLSQNLIHTSLLDMLINIYLCRSEEVENCADEMLNTSNNKPTVVQQEVTPVRNLIYRL